MHTEKPQTVKYFIGALFSDSDLLAQAQQLCRKQIGPLDLTSEAFPFDVTTYYDQEMGRPLFRQFFSIEPLLSPGKLADLKLICNQIEDVLAVAGNRKVNLDIGYLDLHKLVLASAKYNGQKIYLGRGIYADPILFFEAGRFQARAHTFPDFKSGIYEGTLLLFRNTYKAQLKQLAS